MSAFIDLITQKFGRLIVISRGPNDKGCNAQWYCLCECGKGALLRGKDLKSGNTKSCGCLRKEQAARHMQELAKQGLAHQSGEKNPNWNGGVTGKRQAAMSQPEYKNWRKEVFKRDNHTCQKCGDSTGGNLNAHHIESFAGNSELRTEVSNGITFCVDCHKDFHHQYGNSCTRKQVLTFKDKINDKY